MKVNYRIISLISSFLMMITAAGWGQDLPSACGGSRVRYGVSGQPSSTFNWEVTGGTIIANYNDSIDVQWETLEGIKTIRVTEYAQGGCVAAPALAHVMVNNGGADIGDEVIQICEGESHTFVPNILNVTYHWSTGDTTTTIVADKAGMYWVDITNGSCKSRDSAELVINPKLYVDLGNDTALYMGKTIVLDAGFDGAQYKWSTGDITQSIEVGAKKEPVWVQVTSDKGCLSSDTVRINAVVADIPNAFTPNDDGVNDTWNISWLVFYPEASIEIYDRWGRIVYKKKGYSTPGWDGRSNSKPLPMDSYYYILTYDKDLDPVVGNVTIIR